MRRKSSVDYESSSSEALIINRIDPLRVELNLKRRSLNDLGEDDDHDRIGDSNRPKDAEILRPTQNTDVNLVCIYSIKQLLTV